MPGCSATEAVAFSLASQKLADQAKATSASELPAVTVAEASSMNASLVTTTNEPLVMRATMPWPAETVASVRPPSESVTRTSTAHTPPAQPTRSAKGPSVNSS